MGSFRIREFSGGQTLEGISISSKEGVEDSLKKHYKRRQSINRYKFSKPVSPVGTMIGVLGGPLPKLFTAITMNSYSVYGLRFLTVQYIVMMPDISEYAWFAYLGLYCMTKYRKSSELGNDHMRRTLDEVTSEYWTVVGGLGRAGKRILN